MNNERGTTPEAPIVDSAAGVSRRRLLRGGLGASPVLLTLASRPVNAATCTLASSFVSVATFKSRNPGTSAQCANYTCEWWKNECTSGSTHKAYMDATSVTTFLGSTFPGSIYATRSLSSIMKDVAGIQLNTELGVLQHLIALGMNLKGNYATAGNLSQLYINGVWSNYKTNLNMYKLPSSGINWDSAALITWARMLMYPSL